MLIDLLGIVWRCRPKGGTFTDKIQSNHCKVRARGLIYRKGDYSSEPQCQCWPSTETVGKPVADSSSVEATFLSNTYCRHEKVAEESAFGTLNLRNGDRMANFDGRTRQRGRPNQDGHHAIKLTHHPQEMRQFP
jgi:hypothetical protein